MWILVIFQNTSPNDLQSFTCNNNNFRVCVICNGNQDNESMNSDDEDENELLGKFGDTLSADCDTISIHLISFFVIQDAVLYIK